MTIKNELMALMTDDILKPPVVVEWARKNPKSYLHKSLEWDDSKAGHAYRLWQVRQLISVHIVTPEKQREVISLSIDRREGGYRETAAVMRHPALRQIALNDALRELERVQQKYESLMEFKNVWAAISEAKEAMEVQAAI